MSKTINVAGKKIKFAHTAVNMDMHLFIDGFHNPVVCPECIQPGLLVESAPSPNQNQQKEAADHE
jgi:hypothetical protein